MEKCRKMHTDAANGKTHFKLHPQSPYFAGLSAQEVSTSRSTSQGCQMVMLCTPAQYSTGLTSTINTTPPDDRPRHARHLSVHDKCKLQALACAWACSSSQTHCQCHPPCAKPRPSSLRLSYSCFWERPVADHGKPTTTTCY